MTDSETLALIEPLIKRKIFKSTEEAVRQLVAGYILSQIDHYREQVTAFEKRYGMSFDRFQTYLKERTELLMAGNLDSEQKKIIAQKIMLEEDDWLDWKVARDFLNSWLGLQTESAH